MLTQRSIYGEIGPGERIALSKLAVEHFEKHGRAMRIAVDASIWAFQTQAGKGGTNPALRTLYYRLLRLLSLSIRPLFVFDGPNKPPYKRNAKTGFHGASLPDFVTKQLLQLFGFPYHTSPGEAEAECALLQKEGIVDAVLSEDVDTMMFGCTVQLRNWSSENVRGNKVPTHVNLYRAEATKQGKSGLDSDGMILIALMSGGDYIPAGVPRCGIKIALEAARAGFGRDLCRLDKKDMVGFNQWRERLQYELHVNESGHFRNRHKALAIPDNFPDRKVLGYYTHPAVSNEAQIARLRKELKWDGSLDVQGLRDFGAEAFEWKNISGARKFVRGLAPAMLVDKVCKRYGSARTDEDLEVQETAEKGLVTAVCGRRKHFITDSVPELRIAYTPIDIVGLNLDAEEPDVEIAGASDSEEATIEEADPRNRSRSPTKRAPSTYDPTQSEKIWVLESYVRLGVPLLVENWEDDMRDPKRFATRKARVRNATQKKAKRSDGMKPGAMDAFVKTMKPGIYRDRHVETSERPILVEPPTVAADTGHPKRSPSKKTTRKPATIPHSTHSTPKMSAQTRSAVSIPKQQPPPQDPHATPWTLSKRPLDTMNIKLPRGTRFSALGICESSSPVTVSSTPGTSVRDDNEKSQQLPTPTSSGRRRRRNSTPSLTENAELLTSKTVNRRLTFTAHPESATRLPRPATPDSLLPSPSPLLLDPFELELGSAPEPVKPTFNKEKRAKAWLALRESLDGHWRCIEPWERGRAYVKSVFDEVEVVDLTRT